MADSSRAPRFRRYDVVIVGGGLGGCAAAYAATQLGCRVLMTEETDWIGGQLTSQAVPPDEHRWIEEYGCTGSYRRLRELIRSYYRANYPLNAAALVNPLLNPGEGWVSALCCEPLVALAALEQMLAPARSAGLLEVRTRCRAVALDTYGDGDVDDYVGIAVVQDLDSGQYQDVYGDYFLDATELGDLLPMAGAEYVSGAESRGEHGELHAPEGEARPQSVQAFTWCLPVAYDPAPGAEHVIDKPEMYDFWRAYVPDLAPTPWPGPLLGVDYTNPFTLAPRRLPITPCAEWRVAGGPPDLFTYRRIVSGSLYATGGDLAPVQDVSLVNWPQNDYLLKDVIDQPREFVEQAYFEAKQLSLSLLYWMQTELPHPEGRGGGKGYPGLALRPGLVGTRDGLAMAPYIRESRRIRAVFTLTEEHVGAEMLALEGRTQAVPMEDSVGIGHYRIDLHPTTGGDNYLDIESRSFQIPLGSLLPVRFKNLLPACKNLGVTHITNGCTRLHPVEWNVGEASGYLAAWCVRAGHTPHQVREDRGLLEEFQELLRARGVPTEWPEGHLG